MIPRLYESTETAFTTFGICSLAEATSCIVTEERNGQYTLEMQYPTYGLFFNEIKVDRIILAQAHENDTQAQPFRIESISGSMDSIVTIEAVHISYQLNWTIVGKFMYDKEHGTRRPSVYWSHCVSNLIASQGFPFTFETDLDDVYQTLYANGNSEATPFRTMLGGMDGSMLDIWHGEFEWDRYTVKYWQNRGQDNGVRITYGKNLTGLDWETDVSDTYTSVVAFWKQEDEGSEIYVEGHVMSSSIMPVSGNPFAFKRTIIVDASSEFQNEPTAIDLDNYARSYVMANAVYPTVSVKVEFVPLWQTEEYKEYADFEKLNLCDYVTIIYPPLNLELKAQVVKTEYNVLLDRYDSLEISTIKQSLADTIWAMQKEIKKK